MNSPQTDTTAYVFEPVVTDTVARPKVQRPQTPAQAIRMLPSNATEEEKDAIVQKYFKPVIVAPSGRPDTLSLPGLEAKSTAYETMISYKDGFFKDNAYLKTGRDAALYGMAGDPVPYQLRTDVFVTSILMLSFFVVMFIFSRSIHVVGTQLKNFFYNRDRKEIFTLKSDSEMKNQAFIVLLASFLLSILAFKYTETALPESFAQISPYKLLGLDMLILLSYYFLKYLAYSVCNWTFFSSQKRSQWMNAYNLIVLCKAMCFFPLVLVVVYFDLPVLTAVYAFLLILAVSEIMVIFKAKQIFFAYKFGLLHLFLYFCTLEMAPLLFLVGTMAYANRYLIEFV
ncbi:MAG: DUF4271 domain-containing protein [Bacteroidaceae bacterium]|jgi:hypothetical protein|nr:DUF4271 domain-containing protein [Bacteroidaceae bacterium]